MTLDDLANTIKGSTDEVRGSVLYFDSHPVQSVEFLIANEDGSGINLMLHVGSHSKSNAPAGWDHGGD
jgi:hypothetical protein